MPERRVDPITVSVIQHRLHAIVEEMGEAMLRTSYSQILNSSRDFSTAIRRAETENWEGKLECACGSRNATVTLTSRQRGRRRSAAVAEAHLEADGGHREGEVLPDGIGPAVALNLEVLVERREDNLHLDERQRPPRAQSRPGTEGHVRRRFVDAAGRVEPPRRMEPDLCTGSCWRRRSTRPVAPADGLTRF